MTTINNKYYDELVETVRSLADDFENVKLPFPFTIDLSEYGSTGECLIQFDNNCFDIGFSKDADDNFQFKSNEWICDEPDGVYSSFESSWSHDFYETIELLDDLRDSIDDAINHYLNPYNHNRLDFGQEDFDLVCYECGSYLDDQRDENVEFFELLVDHLNPDVFKQDLELIKDEQQYLTQTSFLVCQLNELSC